MKVKKICLECEKEFEAQKTAKYCSPLCRQRAYYKRRYENNPRYCIICKERIPYSSKKWYCSDKCYLKSRIPYKKKKRKEYQKKMHDYKVSQGCSICGYHKCGASLDYHHKEDKDFRIRGDDLISFLNTGNERVKKELDKCILVCKNCHYELHWNENH